MGFYKNYIDPFLEKYCDPYTKIFAKRKVRWSKHHRVITLLAIIPLLLLLFTAFRYYQSYQEQILHEQNLTDLTKSLDENVDISTENNALAKETLKLLNNLSSEKKNDLALVLPPNSNLQREVFIDICDEEPDGKSCKSSVAFFSAFQTVDYRNDPNISSKIKCDIAARKPSNLGNSSLSNNSTFSNITYNHQINTEFAIIDCAAAVIDYPQNPRLKYQLARAYEISENYDKAEEYFKKAAKQGYGKAFSSWGYLYGGGKLKALEGNLKKAYSIFKLGADDNHVDAKVALAHYLQFGYGVEQNLIEAERLLREAYSEKNSDAALRLGYFFENGFGTSKKVNPHQAFKFYKSASDWGDTDGLIQIVDLYIDGHLGEISENLEQDLLGYLYTAQLFGNPWADHYLGWLHENGRLVEKNSEKALDFYEEGLNKKFAYSAIQIGDAYRYGKLGLKKSQLKAFEFFDKAINLGENDGYIYKANTYFDEDFFTKTEQTETVAFDLIKLSVLENPSNRALRNKAWATLYGRGTTAKIDEAIKDLVFLLDKRNDAHSGYILARAYLNGDVIEQDFETAKSYFHRAIDYGHSEAAFDLAEMYYKSEYGDITPVKEKTAYRVAQIGAQRHNTNSTNLLGYFYEQGIGTQQSYEKAISLYQKAEGLGHSLSTNNLGRLYRDAPITEGGSIQKAYDTFKRAMDAGNANAYANIVNLYLNNSILIQDDGSVRAKKSSENLSEAMHNKNYAEAINIIDRGLERFPKNNWLLNRKGWAYENGYGIEKDLNEALFYYSQSSAFGSKWASKRLATHNISFAVGTENFTSSYYYLKVASEQGSVRAAYTLKDWTPILLNLPKEQISFLSCNDIFKAAADYYLLRSKGRTFNSSPINYVEGFEKIYEAFPKSDCGRQYELSTNTAALYDFIIAHNLQQNYYAILDLIKAMLLDEIADQRQPLSKEQVDQYSVFINTQLQFLLGDGFFENCLRNELDFSLFYKDAYYQLPFIEAFCN